MLSGVAVIYFHDKLEHLFSNKTILLLIQFLLAKFYQSHVSPGEVSQNLKDILIVNLLLEFGKVKTFPKT